MDYEEFKKDVSLRLKEIRRKNNDTQEKLATEINISKENLSKIEQGRVNSVSYTHLTRPTKAVECRSRWSPYH